MPGLTAASPASGVVVEIGGLPIHLRVDDSDFIRLLEERYDGFVTGAEKAPCELHIDLTPAGRVSPEQELQVLCDSGQWRMERGDFHAQWDPAAARGSIRQSANPYSIDSMLRILHSLLLAREGGFLVHAASAVRNGRAFLFAGLSGAGKTTLSRLAPPDVTLLTDEISYVRKQQDQYFAFGTPFTGELARLGENLRAPLAGLYLLAQGPENRMEPLSPAEAARALLENILFFAHDPGLVQMVFQAACDFVGRVPVQRLTFLPDARVWEGIA